MKSRPYEVHISVNLTDPIEDFQERLADFLEEEGMVSNDYAISSEEVV